LAHRKGRYLESQGLLKCDAENSYLAGNEFDSGPMAQLQGLNYLPGRGSSSTGAQGVLPADVADERRGEQGKWSVFHYVRVWLAAGISFFSDCVCQ